jgi:hypothetical protein
MRVSAAEGAWAPERWRSEKIMTAIALSHQQREFREALGAAVVQVWAELPEPVQEKLFEHAVIGRSCLLEGDGGGEDVLMRYLPKLVAYLILSSFRRL